MWATYGDNHKGICLVINRKAFKKEIDHSISNSTLKKVCYKANPSNLLNREKEKENLNFELASEQIIKNNWDTIFYTKHHDWITESEIRLVCES